MRSGLIVGSNLVRTNIVIAAAIALSAGLAQGTAPASSVPTGADEAPTVLSATAPATSFAPSVSGGSGANQTLRWHFVITRETHFVAGQNTVDASAGFTLDGHARLAPLSAGMTSYSHAAANGASVHVWAGEGACGQPASDDFCDLTEQLASTVAGTMQVDNVVRDPSGNPTRVKTSFTILPVENLNVTCTGACGSIPATTQDDAAAQILDEVYPGGRKATQF
ncbi:MAG: hypothetical protein ABJA81_12725, partial [Nocardioidaceae bacterium]